MKKCMLLLLLSVFWLTSNAQTTATIGTMTGQVPGTQVDVPITLSGFAPDDIAAFQFTIRYDSTNLKYIATNSWFAGVTGVGILTGSGGGTIKTVTFVWGESFGIVINGVLCNLRFLYKSTATGCESILWSDIPTPRLFSDADYNEYNGTVNPAVTYTNGAICPCLPVTINPAGQPANDSICSGSSSTFIINPAQLSGTPPFTYQWQYWNGSSWINVVNGTPAGSTYINATANNLIVSGITAAGNYDYHCYLTNCGGGYNTTSNTATLSVFSTAPPTVGTITQPTCAVATGSVVLNGLPAAGTWTLNPGGITGTGTTTTISGLASGTYNYTVTNGITTCTSAPSANIVINTQPITPAAPVVGTITQPTCGVATGTVALSGLPTSAWTVTATPGGATITGSTATANFSGLTAGTTYTFTVTLTSSGCTSVASGNAVISTQPITPSAPVVGVITQPTCTVATASVALSGLPTSAWTVTATPGGTTITGSTATANFSGLAAGTTYTFTVTLTSSGCTSVASGNAVVIAQPVTPTAPAVGTITQPTCSVATGSVVLNGLPATGTWTINPGAITGSGTTYTISGLATPGTYSYTVTNDATCTSAPSANIVFNAQPITPSAPLLGAITQPTCSTATGTVALSGLPTEAWTVTATPGGLTITGSTATANFTGLPDGATYTFTVTLTSSGCTSAASGSAVINTQPATEAAPIIGAITQPTCSVATGSVALSGLPTAPWTVTATPGGATLNGSTATADFSGLTAGTYTFTTTLVSSGCISPASAPVTIIVQPVTPSAPIVGTITQPTCAVATGSVVLNGLPGTGTWTINPGGITGSGSSYTLTGLATGTHNLTITNADGCTSAPSANIVIDAQPVTPAAPTVGTITQPTCAVATGGVVLNGLPATGTWTINPGAISGSGTTYTITGLTSGTYNYTVTNDVGCTSTPSAVVINPQPVTPSAPIVGTITQPTCGVATGSVVLNGLPGTGSWTINPGAINGTGTTYTITGVSTGTHNYTVTNADGCTSAASANVVINAQPITPMAPITGTITQPTCTEATGSVALSGLPNEAWTVTATPGGATITGSTPNATFTGLTAGTTYTFTVTLTSSGCTSVASANVVINAQPVTPSAPTVGTITQPTCTVATGSVVLNGLPGTGTWTINPGSITGSGASYTITGLVPGTYSYTVMNADGCTSGVSANIVINNQPTTPFPPAIGAITQPTCTVATGSVVIDSLPPIGTWTINPGAINGSGPTTLLTGLASGTYNFTVTNDLGCTSAPSEDVIINDQPQTPVANAGADVTIGCDVLSTTLGAATVTGYTYVWSPALGLSATDVAQPIASPTATTTYSLTVTNTDGCSSADEVVVTVTFDCEKVMPTAFTPDGDGINDIFPKDFEFVTLTIFDRWGLTLYEGADNNGWDGRYHGQMMLPATYYYKIVFENADGTTTEKIGAVTLVHN
ncbi:MAG TPA: gliding motility-associated C-terminal domain-containing protein [Bacteroidales bacterium]|nr:gliding motility-associated C-terminal domain-containing protein [Bacteroidales bacterium]